MLHRRVTRSLHKRRREARAFRVQKVPTVILNSRIDENVSHIFSNGLQRDPPMCDPVNGGIVNKSDVCRSLLIDEHLWFSL